MPVVLDLYLQDMERRKVTQKSRKTYECHFASFLARCPNLLIRDLRPDHIHEWWQLNT